MIDLDGEQIAGEVFGCFTCDTGAAVSEVLYERIPTPGTG